MLDALPAGARARSALAFAAMCLASGAVYVFNDLQDAERDRAHPKKRSRPIASGRVSAGAAVAVGVVALAAGLAAAMAVGVKPLTVVIVYLVLQVLYAAGGKGVPILDVFLIGTGFVLRAALGAIAIQVQISAWLLLCTGALALLLGFGKRRSEFVLQGEARASSRETLTTAYSTRKRFLTPGRIGRLSFWVHRFAPRLYEVLMRRRLGSPAPTPPGR